jgi:hypothetical protein
MSRIRNNQNRFPSPHSDFSCTQALYFASTQRARQLPHQQTAWPGGQAPGFANRDRKGASTSSAAWPWQAPVAASGRLEAHNQIESSCSIGRPSSSISPPAAADIAPDSVMARIRSFQSLASSSLAFCWRCSALMCLRRAFHASSGMLLSCRTSLA